MVKLDRTAADLDIAQVDIGLLVETVMKRLRPIAMKRDVELVYESVRPVTAAVDEVKISQVVSNLVENAIKYNREHAEKTAEEEEARRKRHEEKRKRKEAEAAAAAAAEAK